MTKVDSEIPANRALAARGAGYDNLLGARALIVESLVAHLGEAGEAPLALSLSYVGTYAQAGHFARPGQIESYAIEGRYAFAERGARAAHRGSLVAAADEAPLTSLTVVSEAGALSQDYGQSEPEVLADSEQLDARAELTWVLPHEILRDALAHAASLHGLGPHELHGRAHELVSYVDARGLSWILYLDADTRRLSRVERLIAHPIEGDTAEWFEFDDYVEFEGLWLPHRRREQRIERWSSWTRELELQSYELSTPEAMFALPEGLSLPAPPASPAVRMSSLADGVYLLELPEQDSKVVAVAFADHCVVLEAPLSSAAGEAIIATLAQRLPDKPIRYLAMSHHHPHYTAGLRPFVHAGVTLLTTPGNRELLESIAERPHHIMPDAQDLSPRLPNIELVEGTRVLHDQAATLELIDVGPESGHTDEYLVFYLPEHHLLFEGDLGWLPSGDPDAFTARRARRLLGIIDGLGREIERVVQSWPLADQRDSVTVEQLRAWAEISGDD